MQQRTQKYVGGRRVAGLVRAARAARAHDGARSPARASERAAGRALARRRVERLPARAGRLGRRAAALVCAVRLRDVAPPRARAR
eukprot:6160148-Prymnesium_polylepis.1